MHEDFLDLSNYVAFDPEYSDENSLNTNSDEVGNQTNLNTSSFSNECNDDKILVTKAEYKKLLDEMVELARLKIKVPKMENALIQKSDEIKRLQRKVRYFEHMQGKQTSEEEKNQNPSIQKDKCDKHSIKVRKKIIIKFSGDLFNGNWLFIIFGKFTQQ